MTRLMARDMCHPRQRRRVSVDRDSPRRHEEKQHSDMRNRIRARARARRVMLNVRAWRLGDFPREINMGGTRKDRSPRKRDERERGEKEKDREKESGGHILLAQVTSRVRATRSNGTFGRLLLRNARGENSGERQRLESRRRLNVSHARDIE